MARGYIRKRATNRWQLTYDAPRGPDGRRNRKYETVSGTKRQAEARLTEILESLRRGQYHEPTRLTLGEYLDQFLAEYVTANCRRKTTEGYESLSRVYIKPCLGHIPLARLSARDIQRYYTDRLETGLTAQSVKHHHALLHRALKLAVDWNILDRNPADRVRSPSPKPSPAPHNGPSGDDTRLAWVHRLLHSRSSGPICGSSAGGSIGPAVV